MESESVSTVSLWPLTMAAATWVLGFGLAVALAVATGNGQHQQHQVANSKQLHLWLGRLKFKHHH